MYWTETGGSRDSYAFRTSFERLFILSALPRTKWMGGMSMEKRVAIVGAGNVGSMLAKAFAQQGYELIGIASKSLAKAARLAKLFGARATTRAAEVTQYADIVVLAIPDDCMEQVVGEIASEDGFWPGQVVLHTSGSVGVDILTAASEQGAFVGGIHPLQSFAGGDGEADILVGTYFAVGGHEQAVKLGETVVNQFGGRSIVLADEQRALYHAGACIVSNYFVSLLHWGAQLYERIGLSPEEAVQAFMPLIESTIKNVQQLGPTNALTGPLSRGDSSTIATHLRALSTGEQHKLYIELAKYTLGIAREKGTIAEQQAGVIKELLDNRME